MLKFITTSLGSIRFGKNEVRRMKQCRAKVELPTESSERTVESASFKVLFIPRATAVLLLNLIFIIGSARQQMKYL